MLKTLANTAKQPKKTPAMNRNGKESQEVKIEPKDKFKESFESGHLFWYSLSYSEQNAFDVFFRRFYT